MTDTTDLTDLTDVTALADLTETIDRHLEAYGEADETRRADLIAQVWATDGRLVDPPLDGRGHQGIGDMAAAVQQHFPGNRFHRTTGVDAHHDVVRYGWELVADDGSVTLAGVDIAQLDAAGRLVRVTGFFGDPPALDA